MSSSTKWILVAIGAVGAGFGFLINAAPLKATAFLAGAYLLLGALSFCFIEDWARRPLGTLNRCQGSSRKPGPKKERAGLKGCISGSELKR